MFSEASYQSVWFKLRLSNLSGRRGSQISLLLRAKRLFAAAHQTIGLEMSGRRPNQNANAISAAELSRLCRALSVGNAHASRLIMDAINAAPRGKSVDPNFRTFEF
jgi:hypothetical protein